MRTIEEVRGRCRIEPGDKEGQEHWIWAGAYDRKVKNGTEYRTPVMRAPDFARDPSGQQTWVQYGPKAVFNILHRKGPRKGLRVYSTCTEHGCISPDCVRAMTPSSWGKLLEKSGRLQNERWSMHANRIWDERGRKFTPDQVRLIRESEIPVPQLAVELGAHDSHLYRIRRGDAYKQVTRQEMGVFGGLLR